MESDNNPFNTATWEQLPAFFEKLPELVHIVMWGDEEGSRGERETAVLCRALAERFDTLRFSLRPRRANYDFYPVIGFMGEKEGEEADFGVRIIGWPAGYQLTSFITAIQAVAFGGATLEPATRIRLQKLATDVNIEVMTAVENESGALVAKVAFGLAVANPHIRAYLIVVDSFPQAVARYAGRSLPFTVVNSRVYVEGVLDEAELLKQIGLAVG